MLQLFALCRGLLGPDYTETYYSPRGEEITTRPQNVVSSQCFLGFFLESATYVRRFISARTTFKKLKDLKARCSSMNNETRDEKNQSYFKRSE